MQRQLTQTGAATPAGSGSSPILDGGSSGGGKSGSPPDKTTSGKPEGEGGDSGRPSTGLWKLYLDALASQPLITKSVTCALLNLLGDLFSQIVLEGGSIDVKRAVIFTGMGLFFVGPTLHVWYSNLNKLVPYKGSLGAVVQLMWDQLFFAPIFLSGFITVLFTLNGDAGLVKAKLQADLLTTVQANWLLWVPAQFLNFRFAPPNLQVLVANCVALIWNVYMSYSSHKKVEVVA
ncbi:MAG: hypothetical protein WDW36_000324 [Sanguina aurantia]